MEKKLEVKNLKISFRTQGGKVQAVRDISFDLYKGETLALVGESGSGKSVTNRAIIGILAGNAIVEGGEILYDGQDLLKVSEEEFHKLRGDKIAMIFQDPMSSLNPIPEAVKKHASLCKTFDNFCISATKMESVYNEAMSHIIEMQSDIDNILFLIEKNQVFDRRARLGALILNSKRAYNDFLIKQGGEFDGIMCAMRSMEKIRLLAKKKSRFSNVLTHFLNRLWKRKNLISFVSDIISFATPNLFLVLCPFTSLILLF